MTNPPAVTLSYSDTIDATAQPVFALDGNASMTSDTIQFPTAGATLMLWLQTTMPTAGVILGYAQQPATNAGRLWVKNPANLQVGIGSVATVATNLSCNDGAWHHLAITVAPVNAQTVAVGIYLDGAPAWFGQSALTSTGGIAVSASGTLVLGQGVTGDINFTGNMSQFVLWNSVLSPAAILSAMQTRPVAGPNTVIDWGLSADQSSAHRQGGSFVTSNPPLRYRSNRLLTASWIPATIAGSTFDVSLLSSDNTYYPMQSGIASSPVTWANPSIGIQYAAGVRVVTGSTVGAWSPGATAVPLELGQAVPVLAPAASPPFNLTWTAVDQSALYAMSFLQGGTTPVPPSGNQSQTSVDVTALVQNATNTYTYTVAATGAGSIGPASAVTAMPPVPTLTMTYAPVQGTDQLVATWLANSGTSAWYLSVVRSGSPAATVAATILAGATTSYTVPGVMTEGQIYTATLRGLATGDIGPWSAAVQVIVHVFGTPVFGTITTDFNTTSMTVPWTFTAPAGVTAKFDLQLWNSDQTQMILDLPNATSPQQITNAAIVQGAVLSLRIRAYADNSYGSWSAWQSVTVEGVPQVTGVSALVDAYGAITVSWTAVQDPALQGVAYIVTVYKPDHSKLYTSGAQTGASVVLNKTTTGVQDNTTYTVTVYATATGYSHGPESAPAVSVAVGTIQPYPPPNSNYIIDPINTGSGAFAYINEDLTLNGVMPLRFTTCYSSDRQLPSDNPLVSNLPLGNRWNHNYNSYVRVDTTAGFAYVVWGLGGFDRYAIPSGGNGSYANAGAKLGSSFVKNSNGTYTVTQPDQQAYMFDAGGKLTTITDRIGNVANLVYSGSQLQTITDPQSSHTLTLTYSGQYLATVSDGTHTVGYSVVNNNLMSMTNPLGKTRQFTYKSGLTAMIETVVGYTNQTLAKNTYTNNRITQQQDARALAQHLSYGSTFQWSTGTYATTQSLIANVTDRMGNTSRYESIAGNGALVNERYQLDSTNILVRSYTYDAYANRLSKLEYRGPSAGYQTGMGNTTTYTYATDGQPATTIVSLPNSRISAISNGYTGGNLTSTRVYEGPAAGYQPTMGNLTTRFYNTDKTLQWIQPPLGAKTQFTYWSGTTHGQIKTMTDALGNVFNMTWWPSGLVDTSTDPYGNVTTLVWDSFARVDTASIANSAGAVLQSTKYGYNNINQITSIALWFPSAGQTQAAAYTTTITYDDNGNLYQVTDPASVTATYGYDENFNLTSVTWPPFQSNTRSVTWTYDRDDFKSGTVWSASNPAVQQITANNQLGECVQYTDPMNSVYTYAAAMTPGTGPLALTTTTNWPPPSGSTGAASTTAFDALGRVTRVVDRANIATTVAYATQNDPQTNTQQTVVTTTRPPAASGGPATVTASTYDAMGRIVQFVDANGKTSTWAYTIETDASTGKFVGVETMTDPTGRTIANGFDSLSRLAFTRRAGPNMTRSQSYSYDAIGRIVQVTETQGSDTSTTIYSYGYDSASGCVTTSIGRPGGNGGNTVYYFNGRGSCVKQVNPFGQPVTSTFAPWGSLAGYTDGRGNAFTYTFDKAGRLITTTPSPGNAVAQTLDASGNRLTTQSGSLTITRTFDKWNRMSTRTDANSRQVGYQYWPEDQLKQLTYPDGKAVNYILDGLGRTQTVTDWAGRAVTYGWLPTNIVTAITYKNAAASAYATVAYNYDDAGRPTGYTHQAGNLILGRAQYILDGLGQPATASIITPLAPTLPSAAQTFTYTSGNAIATINGAAQDIDTDGDYLGPNSTPAVVAYDNYGRITGYGADTYSYDLDGLRTGATIGGKQTTSVYDISHWQSPQVERGDPSRAIGAAVTQPTPYDVLPWHPVEIGQGKVTPWGFALDRQLVNYDSSGNVTARHVHGVGLIGSENAAGSFAAALTDLTGNVGTLVTDAGLPMQRYVYGPYGDLYAQAGPAGYPFRYNGRDGVLDDGNGLLHMRARGYAPGQFRFLQPDYLTGDPLRTQTLNRYAYSAGNPVQNNDPAGLAVIGIAIGVGVIAIGVGIAYGLGLLGGGGGAAGGVGGAAGGIGGGVGGNGGRPPSGNSPRPRPPTQEPGTIAENEPLLTGQSRTTGNSTLTHRRPFSVDAEGNLSTEMDTFSSSKQGGTSSFSNNRSPSTPSAINWDILKKTQ